MCGIIFVIILSLFCLGMHSILLLNWLLVDIRVCLFFKRNWTFICACYFPLFLNCCLVKQKYIKNILIIVQIYYLLTYRSKLPIKVKLDFIWSTCAQCTFLNIRPKMFNVIIDEDCL